MSDLLAARREESCPVSQAERREDREAIVACAQRLPPGEREAFKLVHLKGLSTVSTGRLLDISTDAAYQRAKRGLQKISRYMAERFQPPSPTPSG